MVVKEFNYFLLGILLVWFVRFVLEIYTISIFWLLYRVLLKLDFLKVSQSSQFLFDIDTILFIFGILFLKVK